MAASLVRQGKVRDIYDLGDRYLLVASDRISAFDWVIPTAIPDKGRVLTQITQFWLETFDIPNHLLGTAVRPEDCPEGVAPEWLAGRSMVVKKCEVVPVECVVRGYLVGSGWKEYQQTQSVCGVALPEGLVNCSQLETPIFQRININRAPIPYRSISSSFVITSRRPLGTRAVFLRTYPRTLSSEHGPSISKLTNDSPVERSLGLNIGRNPPERRLSSDL